MPVSKAQISYVHVMEHTPFVSLQFSRKRFCGHSTFVLQTIELSCVIGQQTRNCLLTDIVAGGVGGGRGSGRSIAADVAVGKALSGVDDARGTARYWRKASVDTATTSSQHTRRSSQHLVREIKWHRPITCVGRRYAYTKRINLISAVTLLVGSCDP